MFDCRIQASENHIQKSITKSEVYLSYGITLTVGSVVKSILEDHELYGNPGNSRCQYLIFNYKYSHENSRDINTFEEQAKATQFQKFRLHYSQRQLKPLVIVSKRGSREIFALITV